ncbi:hypothetical protein BJX64DRAFT_291908 [Aspergillus heterothallicus]
MPVRELACLRLKNNEPLTAPANADTLSQLRAGLQEQARYTNADAHILTQIEDPSILYILGKWDSVAQHVAEWIPSETNQAIMGGLAGDLEVVWLQHVELGSADGEKGDGAEEIPLAANVIAVGRYFVSPGRKEEFETIFGKTKHHLQEFNGGKGIWGSWREDREADEEGNTQEEFVLFSGWADVDEHMRFAESEGFKEFAKIKEFLKGAEIKHGKLLVSEKP